MPDRRGWRRRRGTILGVVAVVVAGGGVAAYASTTGSSTPDYVTATVSRGDVSELGYLSGTVDLVNRTTAVFPVSGVVKAVHVEAGQTVAKGQPLASLEPQSLQLALTAAKATLASAQATLETDQTATDAALTPVASATTSAATRPTSKGSGGTTTAQKQLTADSAAATRAVGAEGTACTGVLMPMTPTAPAFPSGTHPHVDPSPAPPAAPPSPSASAPTTSAADALTLQACAAALQSVQSAQAKVTADQTTLTRLLTSTPTAAPPSKVAAPSTQTRTSGGGASSVTTESKQSAAIRVITDKAAVTSAQAAVTTAGRQLAESTLHAPIAGVVQSVGLKVGSAASSSTGIAIVGTGDATVTLDVPLETLKVLKIGQPVQVTPAGATTSVPATIQSLGLLATTGASATTYTVVVLVHNPPAALSSGSTAGVSIELASAKAAITVPGSAVTPLTTTTGIVQTLVGSTVTPTRVTLGAVGPLTTQIVSGLKVGDRVVLADPSQALPASSSTLNARTLIGGGGGFPGGGAGFGGGGGFARTGAVGGARAGGG